MDYESFSFLLQCQTPNLTSLVLASALWLSCIPSRKSSWLPLLGFFMIKVLLHKSRMHFNTPISTTMPS